MEIDLILTNLLYEVLTELNVNDPKEILGGLTNKNGVIVIKFDTSVNNKKVINRIKEYLIANYDSFKVNIVINNKAHKLRYPNLYRIFLKSSLLRQIRLPFNYALLAAMLPLIISAFFLKYSNVSLEVLNNASKTISDNFINICFLLSTLIITYLITKVVAIKQEKNNRIILIRQYSNQLTEFRRICQNLLTDYSFFTNRSFSSYADSIKKKITFEELENPFNNAEFEQKARTLIYDSKHSEVMLRLYLQLYSFYLEGGFNPLHLFATHAANYIYKSEELNKWKLFMYNNLIWYVFDNERGVYENAFSFNNQAYGEPIIESAKRFDSKKFKKAEFNSELLLEISLDVQYVVLPNLITLVKKNEEGLPFVFKYFISCFGVIVLCGVVIKTFFDLFYPSPLIDLLSILITIMILVHMAISLKFILRDELFMDTDTDYV